MARRLSRRVACGLALAVLGLSGCGALPGAGDRSAPTAPASATGNARPAAPAGRFAEPADPCAAVEPATAEKFKLVRPSKTVLPGADSDPASGQIVDYNILRCSWSVDNPAKGPNGRPNYLSMTVTYSVIDKKFPKCVEVAKGIYDLRKEKLGTNPKRQVKRTDAPAGLGEEAVYSFAQETTSVGESAVADLLVRTSNAHVSISFSGADLRLDPSKPRGLQLVTSPVTEERLQPAVLGIAGDVLRLLG